MLFGYEQAARVHIISEEEKMETTIAAISTAMSASGIGIVRISGENAMDVISRVYRSKGGKKFRLIPFIMDIFMMERNWWMRFW